VYKRLSICPSIHVCVYSMLWHPELPLYTVQGYTSGIIDKTSVSVSLSLSLDSDGEEADDIVLIQKAL